MQGMMQGLAVSLIEVVVEMLDSFLIARREYLRFETVLISVCVHENCVAFRLKVRYGFWKEQAPWIHYATVQDLRM
jgi:hypothetical protein